MTSMVSSRKAALITGGNSGIGFECARRLARAGLQVIVASRDRKASAAAVRRIVQETGNEAVEEMGLDLGSTAAVRKLAKEIEALDVPLHALVCNAGLQVVRGPVLSPDGFELTFAVNHLGHFLLANLLLDRLVAHAPARVMIVSSGVHDPRLRTGMPRPAVTDMESLARRGGPDERPFNGRLAYVNSKLCNLWFAYELVRRIDAAGLSTAERPLSVNAFEPGLVPGSGLARDYPAALRFIWDHVLPVLVYLVPTVNTAERAGSALAELVLDPDLERASGRYFPSHARYREAPSSEDSYDAERAARLWDASVRLCALSKDESPLLRL
jgi:NAD(P)-dependent dehydrogenase (short-subunit alcohol dehydrogenase family)